MNLGTIEKQPREKQNYFIRYKDYLQTGETVSAVTYFLSGDDDALVIQGPTIRTDNESLEFWVAEGTDYARYLLEVKITTSLGNEKEDEITIKVKEIN
jgi:hypothetical protein